MNPLHDKLIQRPDTQQKRAIAKEILAQPRTFSQLWETFLDPPCPRWQILWVMDEIIPKSPEMLMPYLNSFIEHIQSSDSSSERRHYMKILAESKLDLNSDQKGILVDLAFQFLQSPTEAVAVKAHSMMFIYQQLDEFPELGQELIETLQMGMENGSTGYVARAKKIINGIKKGKRSLK